MVREGAVQILGARVYELPSGEQIAATAMFPAFTVTALPETSETWPVGSDGFPFQSDDPVAPWSGTSAQFRGTAKSDTAERLGAASIVYRYRLEFN